VPAATTPRVVFPPTVTFTVWVWLEIDGFTQPSETVTGMVNVSAVPFGQLFLTRAQNLYVPAGLSGPVLNENEVAPLILSVVLPASPRYHS